MELKLSQRTVRELFELAGSTAPVPGGGAVSALCGVLGVALILKALRISVRGKDLPKDFRETEVNLERLAALLEGSADEDSLSFQAYITAVKLPRSNETEKSLRRDALQHAAMHASLVAYQTFEQSKAAIEAARHIEYIVAEGIKADIVAGIALLRVTCGVAGENISANISVIKGKGERASIAEKLSCVRSFLESKAET